MTASKKQRNNIFSEYLARGMRRLREQLATGQAPFEHALLGLAAGLVAGLAILAFRKSYEWLMISLIPQNGASHVEALGFSALPAWMHFALPALGGTLIGLALWRVAKNQCHVGLAHVVLHVDNKDGKLPWQNALVQFFGGIACLVSGQSVGREGPAVHLGVASNSLIGQMLHLPHNSLRVLAGCSTAAAIAASFNTPIAGVIFAMEVVLAEYTIAGFIPVILASVTGTVVARLAYGDDPLLVIPEVSRPNLDELLLVVVLALLVSIASASFVRIQRFCLGYSDRPIALRLAVAGTATGLLALIAPQIMGVSVDTLQQLINTPIPLLALAALVVAKLLATSLSIGLGMPGGMIGPNLFLGACIGALLGQSIELLNPELIDSTSLYALLGMAAMMSAVLNAPLAALMTLMELTYNPDIIFPGLLAITVANICHRELFSQPSAVAAVLQQQGVDLQRDPVTQALQRLGASSVMNTNVALSRQAMQTEELRELTTRKPDWIIHVDKNDYYLLDARALSEFLKDYEEQDIDLLSLSLAEPIDTVDSQSDLSEAWQCMLGSGHNAVCVRSKRDFLLKSNIGVITRKVVETHIYRRYGAN